MSSAKHGLRRVSIGGLSALVGGAAMFGLAGTANADWNGPVLPTTPGQIGIVDTSTAAGTNGATLVMPGTSGQAVDNLRLLVPNSFKNGDTIDLAIFDRTATTADAGLANSDSAHKLGFGATPSVTVGNKPLKPGTKVGPTGGAGTEATGFPAAGDIDSAAPGVPTTAPSLTASLVSSSRANGLAQDIVRLTVNGTAANGHSDDLWEVTVSGLKLDLGTNVSPGEVRVAPFAYNGTPTSTASGAQPGVFGGNQPGTASTAPTIAYYTVPAYVSPVSFAAGTPANVTADGTTQKVGDFTIGETNNYSLQPGTYTLTVSGATVKNGATGDAVTASLSGGATGETVSVTGTTANTVTISVAGPTPQVNQAKSTITLKGVELAAGAAGKVTYTLTGGSIDQFLTTAGTSPAIGSGTDGITGVPADLAGVNQTDIQAPDEKITAQATSPLNRIGGADRYSTAAKIAEAQGAGNGDIIIASGENFPDALSANYLAGVRNSRILLTKKGSLPQATINAMKQVGVSRVFIVGGTAVVSNQVKSQIEAMPVYSPGGTPNEFLGHVSVVRLSGANRFDTNEAVNDWAAANSLDSQPVGSTNITFGVPAKRTAIVATGSNYPDALAAGVATAYGNYPLILTEGGSLSPQASAQLDDLSIQQVIIVGGSDVVSSGVASSISGKGIAVKRIAGADRYATATALADFENAKFASTSSREGGLGFEFGDGRVYLATGENYADALVAGPLAAMNADPILLTAKASLSGATGSWLTANAADYFSVQGLGLASAVSDAALNAANAAVDTE